MIRLWVMEHLDFVIDTTIGVLGSLIAIATVINQRQPEQLDYKVRTKFRLSGPHSVHQHEELEVTSGNSPIDEPWILVVLISLGTLCGPRPPSIHS
jgi:hypothetical protein